jgi:Zn-dependent membrane protease YugP
MPYFYIDPYYLMLVVPAVLIALIAQVRVKSAFRKYSQLLNQRGYTGYEIARRILDINGLSHVRIEQVAGSLTDHFDPSANVVRLSSDVYNSTSVAAIGVAAHECGHAVQYRVGYFPIKIRKAILPVTQIGSSMALPLAILGLVFGIEWLVTLGIVLFSVVVLFQLITLPVEFNASRRALQTIRQENILESEEEYKGAKSMLTAAALTYVAAMIVALANLLRLILLANRRSR